MPKAPSQAPGKGRPPWHQQSSYGGHGNGGAQGARSLVHEGRIVGNCQDWQGSWGWVQPLQKISHPLLRGNRLYCHSRDVQVPGGQLKPGMTVDFLLYADGRGLGCADVREASLASQAQAGGEEEESETLPEGWEKVWSEEHGEYYYWNKSTKESSWVQPVAQEEEEEELPEGWSKNFDPEQNEYYYWHAATKTTTWERPKAPAKEEAAQDPPEQEEEEEAAGAADGPVLGQQRVKGRVEKWQKIFGWIAPLEELGEELKPLLENRQDRIYCNWRDVREGTALEVGSVVDFLLYADENGLGASDVRLLKDAEEEEAQMAEIAAKAAKASRGGKGGRKGGAGRDAVADLERQWAAQDKAMGVAAPEEKKPKAAAAAPSHGVADAMDMEDAPLLPGWEQHYSEENSCYFYWHKPTKQSSWERPCLPGAVSSKKPEKVWEGEGSETGAARLATPITPVGPVAAGKEITPLTPATAQERQEALKRGDGPVSRPSSAYKPPSQGNQGGGYQGGKGWQQDSGASKRSQWGGGKGGWGGPNKKARY